MRVGEELLVELLQVRVEVDRRVLGRLLAQLLSSLDEKKEGTFRIIYPGQGGFRSSSLLFWNP